MKKGLYVILAVLTVFAMVMVSCGGDETEKTNTYTVTYNGNGNTGGTAPAKAEVKIGEKVIIPDAGTLVKTGSTFEGWNTKADGTGTTYQKDEEFTPTKNTTLYAKWSGGEGPGPIDLYPLPAGAVELGDFTWVNNDNQKGWKSNGMDNEETGVSATDITTAEYLVLDLSAAPTGGLQFVWQGDAAGSSWPWNQTDVLGNDGSPDAEKGTAITEKDGVTVLTIELSKAAKDYDLFKKNSVVKILIAYYAGGIDGLGLERAYLTGSLDTARAEKVSLPNSAYAIYSFTLPAGKTFADYKSLSASYMFEAEDLAAAQSRNGRIMGPYGPKDFSFRYGTGDADGHNLAVAAYGSGTGDDNKNGPYILDGGRLGNAGKAGGLVEELGKIGITPEGGKWFTLGEDYYRIDGTNKNGDFPATRLEALMASGGTLYFGVGLPSSGANDPGNKYYIRDVKLIGYNDADTVTATPLWFEKDGGLFPAFSCYPTTDGSNGYLDTDREKLNSTITIITDPLARAEKVSLANSAYAIYRFELPAGKTFADYKSLSASYMFEAEDLAAAQSRNGRIMGPYGPSDFSIRYGTGDAAGYNLAVASYGSGTGLDNKNGPYILDGGRLGNAGKAGGLLEELAKINITPVGGEWFTLGEDYYRIDGTNKNGDLSKERLDALMDSGGVLYFGVGLPSSGANDPGNKHYIRDVKLIGYSAADTVTATPLWFERDGKSFPAFSCYPTTDGSNGYLETGREKLNSTISTIQFVDLGTTFTASNDATQEGWCSNGTDNKTTDLDIADLIKAKYLVLEMPKAPTGGMQFIWQGTGNNWGWGQQDGILTDTGGANPEKGSSFSNDGKTLKIELSKAAKDYDKFIVSTQTKFFIAYYSSNVADLGITKAYLTSE